MPGVADNGRRTSGRSASHVRLRARSAGALGIDGTRGIPAAFAADLRGEPKAGELLAVASRGSARAEAFDRVGSMIGLGYPFEEPR